MPVTAGGWAMIQEASKVDGNTVDVKLSELDSSGRLVEWHPTSPFPFQSAPQCSLSLIARMCWLGFLRMPAC